jgi:oligosaccharide repeat unit polymerase
MLIILLETAIEGYIPLLSMMSGSSISHFDFGISSLHGFCLALGALNTGLLFYIFLKTRSREQIILIFAHLIIFALLVTRKMIVISLIQMFFIYLCMKKINISKKTIPIFLALVVSVFIFGWIGDARTGRDLFLSLANLNFYYPEWMPSGLIWVYIYCVTPILNLTNALYSYTSFSNDLQFICSMVPSVFRSGLACSSSLGFDNEYQISGAFNIATGYIPLYESWGKIGIIIFSFIHGVVASYVTTSFKMNALKIVFYALFMQTTILLIFSNGFLNLNVLAQFFILPVLLWNTRTPQQNPRIFST